VIGENVQAGEWVTPHEGAYSHFVIVTVDWGEELWTPDECPEKPLKRSKVSPGKSKPMCPVCETFVRSTLIC
jgi:hypothetical protein